MTTITGNTYPVRVELRSLGATWDAVRRAWIVPDERAEIARALVARCGHKSYRKPGRHAMKRCP
jgi:hypothetical protein